MAVMLFDNPDADPDPDSPMRRGSTGGTRGHRTRSPPSVRRLVRTDSVATAESNRVMRVDPFR